jgi:hypothetical protein
MKHAMRKRFSVRTNVALFALGNAVALLGIGMPTRGYADDTLLPDLVFQVDCSQNPRSDFEDQVARYLTDQGFRVVDTGKSPAHPGADEGRHELTGIDRRNRIVTIASFPRRPNLVTFTLLSTPPTRHDPGFDSAIQTFFSRDLICEVSQIVTHDNSPDSVASFTAEVNRINALLDVSDGMDASTSKR